MTTAAEVANLFRVKLMKNAGRELTGLDPAKSYLNNEPKTGINPHFLFAGARDRVEGMFNGRTSGNAFENYIRKAASTVETTVKESVSTVKSTVSDFEVSFMQAR